MRRWVVFAWVLVQASGCGSPAAEPASAPPSVDPAPEAPGAEAIEESAELEEPRPIARPRGDLLRCPVEVRVLALGVSGDRRPSAPVRAGDGVLVAFTRSSGEASDLVVQRATLEGALGPEQVVRRGVHTLVPRLVGDAQRIYAVTVRDDRTPVAIPLDPVTGAATGEADVTLPEVVDGVSLDERGLVMTYVDDRARVLHRDGRPDARLARQRSFAEPPEVVLASSAEREVVLVRAPRGVTLAFVASDGAVTRSPILFRESSTVWTEASVAAGPSGFALVRTGPGVGDLEIHLASPDGALAAPSAIPRPAPTEARPADSLVRRYPRVAPLAGGWALTYWDGTGPSLVRVDGAGQATSDPIELRSGDERGGHTDAPSVEADGYFAVTWQVAPPRFGHGFADEEPDRPGPRLALVSCARE